MKSRKENYQVAKVKRKLKVRGEIEVCALKKGAGGT